MKRFVPAIAVLLLAQVAYAEGQAPAASSAASAKDNKEKERQAERARERCRSQRGADCDSADGLREWQLQERSRAEAVREGSRHRLPGR